LFGHHRIVHDGRDGQRRHAEQVAVDDDQRDAGRADVLLRAGVDQANFSTLTGRDRMCDDMSATSGTPVSAMRSAGISTPWMVSLCADVQVGGGTGRA
jgi:hypothetical protein